MKVIIGTYRGPEYVKRSMKSLAEKVGGWTDLVIVDDSGNRDWVREYRDMRVRYSSGRIRAPKVIATNGEGYNAAMRAVCAEAGDEEFFFWEEDFVMTTPIELRMMSLILEENPDLAQIALLRGPHFPIEHEQGGVIEALVAKGHRMEERPPGIIVQSATFTGNPSVWRAGIAKGGWPAGRWSEDRMRDRLLKEGYKFGYLRGISVEHDGVRSGHSY